MKVLFINTLDKVGGAAVVVDELMCGLSKLNIDCKCLVGYKLGNNEQIDVVKKRFGYKYDFLFNNAINKLFSNDIDFGHDDEIFNHPWYKEADIIHLNNLHGGFFKLENLIRMSKEKKVVWTFHDEWPIMAHGACVLNHKMLKGFFLRDTLATYPSMLFNNADYLISKKTKIYNRSKFVITVPSMWLKKLTAKSILKSKQIEIIHNGIDVNIYYPDNKIKCRKILKLPNDKKIILFVADGGINNTWKGWKYMKNIIDGGINDNYLFIVVGGSRFVRKNVISVGYVNKETLSKYYSAADVLVAPSIVESFGNVVVEAMACGLSVVTFSVGVVSEIVKHKMNGYVAKYLSSTDLLSGINYCLNHIDKNELVESSKNIRKQFSIEKQCASYLKIYKQLVANE